MNIKLTQNQQLLLSALLSMLGSALIAGSTAAYQSSHGSIDVGTDLNVALATFLAFFGKSLYDFVPGHIAQLIQGLQETIAELRKAPAQSQAVQGPLVVVHTSSPQAQPPQIVPVQVVAPPIVEVHPNIPATVQTSPTSATVAHEASSQPIADKEATQPMTNATAAIQSAIAQRQQ